MGLRTLRNNAGPDLLRQGDRSGNAPWAAGFDVARYGGSIVAALKAAGADGWFAHFSDATEHAINDAHARGLKVGAWTVDDPAQMRALAARGIDAICTDHPDVSVALPKRSCHSRESGNDSFGS